MLQVSASAKTGCKICAWMCFFDQIKYPPRRAGFWIKIEENMIFEGLRGPKRRRRHAPPNRKRLWKTFFEGDVGVE